MYKLLKNTKSTQDETENLESPIAIKGMTSSSKTFLHRKLQAQMIVLETGKRESVIEENYLEENQTLVQAAHRHILER